MKVHTTNYQDTFIAVADDCPATQGEVPPSKGDTKSVANLQFELLSKKPYQYTSDEVLFQVYARRNDLTESELANARVHFFSKGQPCFRASPLTKRYGLRPGGQNGSGRRWFQRLRQLQQRRVGESIEGDEHQESVAIFS